MVYPCTKVIYHNNSPHAQPIFPIPSGNPRQVIQITRAQVFGTAILTGRNPSDTYLLQVEELRQKGQDAIRQMGFVPA